MWGRVQTSTTIFLWTSSDDTTWNGWNSRLFSGVTFLSGVHCNKRSGSVPGEGGNTSHAKVQLVTWLCKQQRLSQEKVNSGGSTLLNINLRSDQSRRQKTFNTGGGGFAFVQGAWQSKIWQKLLICSVCYFNLDGLEVPFGGTKHTKAPCSDKTVSDERKNSFCCWSENLCQTRHASPASGEDRNDVKTSTLRDGAYTT